MPWYPGRIGTTHRRNDRRLEPPDQKTQPQHQDKGTCAKWSQQGRRRPPQAEPGKQTTTKAVGEIPTRELDNRIAPEKSREDNAEPGLIPTQFADHDRGGNGNVGAINMIDQG